MRTLVSYVLDVLFPPRESERVVRALTLDDLYTLGSDTLPYHDKKVTALVWELKYFGSKESRALAAGYLHEQVLAAVAEEVGTPLLIPVPMHSTRRRARGLNHTELLCHSLLPTLREEVEYAPGALERLVDTPTQQGLSKAARIKNVQHSMRADSAIVRGRGCIVVDDVTTTGATLAEAARALRDAGARSVHTIALARS